MSAIEKLTDKILEDAKTKAAELLEDARTNAAQFVAEAEAEARGERDKILADAVVEARRREEQIVLGKTLSVRDICLEAKQQVLEKVFATALEQMENMSREDYLRFLVDSLSELDLDGEELILPEKYGIANLDEVNAALKQRGKKGNLTLCQNPRQRINGGFILAKGGIEQNNSVEAMLSFHRYELESEVAEKLF